MIVISRAEPPHQCAGDLANDLIGQIGWEDLRLTLEETAAIAKARKELDDETLGSLHDQSNVSVRSSLAATGLAIKSLTPASSLKAALTAGYRGSTLKMHRPTVL